MTKFNKKPIGTDANNVGSWFPFTKHRYDTATHPIVLAGDVCKSKVEFPASVQETQMLAGLANTLQVDEQTALRIALYEGCKAPEQAKLALIRANPLSKVKGHTSRDKKVAIKLPGSETKALKALAKTLNISDRQAARACLIMLARGTQSGNAMWKKLSGCKKISQDELGNAWRNEKKANGTWSDEVGSSLGSLRDANDEAIDQAHHDNELLYARRGDKAKELVAQGLKAWVFPDDYYGKMDISFVDEQIAIEDGELDDRYPELTEEELAELEALDVEEIDLSFLENTPPITLASVMEPMEVKQSRVSTPEYKEHYELMGKGNEEDTEKALRYFMGSESYDRYLAQLNRRK